MNNKEKLDALLLTPQGTFLNGYVVDNGEDDLTIGILYGEGRNVPQEGDRITIHDVYVRIEDMRNLQGEFY